MPKKRRELPNRKENVNQKDYLSVILKDGSNSFFLRGLSLLDAFRISTEPSGEGSGGGGRIPFLVTHFVLEDIKTPFESCFNDPIRWLIFVTRFCQTGHLSALFVRWLRLQTIDLISERLLT